MASFIQENDNSAGATPATTITVALTGVVAGRLIAIFVKQEGVTDCGMVVTDGIGNTLTARTKQANPGPNSWGQWHTYLAPSSGDFTYTCTFSPSSTATYPAIFVYEIAPAAGMVWAYDTESTSNGTSTSLTSGNFTTTGPGIVLVGYAEITGATLSNHAVNSAAADRVDETAFTATIAWIKTHGTGFTGAATATLSTGDDWVAAAVAYTEVWSGGSMGYFRGNRLRPRIFAPGHAR